jgi:hypothetical protein
MTTQNQSLEEAMPWMRVLTQEELNAGGSSSSNASDAQTVNLDNTIKKYLPSLDEFKSQRNEFNKLVKEMADLMVQKLPTLSTLEAAKMFNSPINYLSLHFVRNNLNELKVWLQDPNNRDKNIPSKLKLFYWSDNDLFFGKLTVVAIIEMFFDFCFERIKDSPFSDIEKSFPDETEPQKIKERQEKIEKKQKEYKAMMEPIIKSYISNHMSPHCRKLRKDEPVQAPDTPVEQQAKRRRLK